jgi:DNA-binding MarR family transcriptional regulator
MPLSDVSRREEIFALAEALRPGLLRVSRRLRREAQKAGLSALDVQLMAIIQKHPGVGAAELAEREQMTRPSMSGHVKRMSTAGWIIRDPTADDGRRVGLRLSPAGEQALEAIRQRRNDWLAERLLAVGPDARAALAAAAAPLARLAEV